MIPTKKLLSGKGKTIEIVKISVVGREKGEMRRQNTEDF